MGWNHKGKASTTLKLITNGYSDCLVYYTRFIDNHYHDPSISQRIFHFMKDGESVPMCGVCRNTPAGYGVRGYQPTCGSDKCKNTQSWISTNNNRSQNGYHNRRAVELIDKFKIKFPEYELLSFIGTGLYDSKKCNIRHMDHDFSMPYKTFHERMARGTIGCGVCNKAWSRASQKEIKFGLLIDNTIGAEIIRNCRQTIQPYELDFVLPYYRLAIEFNGDYFHANPKYYDADDIINSGDKKVLAKDVWAKDEMKKKLAHEVGYDLMIIWESDFDSNPKKVENMLRDYVGVYETVWDWYYYTQINWINKMVA